MLELSYSYVEKRNFKILMLINIFGLGGCYSGKGTYTNCKGNTEEYKRWYDNQLEVRLVA